MTTGCALIDMSTKSSCAATLNGGEHFQMKPIQPVPVIVNELAACKTHHIGHLQRRSGGSHGLSPVRLQELLMTGPPSASRVLGVARMCTFETWR